jgi:hypothetical protein
MRGERALRGRVLVKDARQGESVGLDRRVLALHDGHRGLERAVVETNGRDGSGRRVRERANSTLGEYLALAHYHRRRLP